MQAASPLKNDGAGKATSGDESSLLARIRAGEPAAIAQFVENQTGPLLAVARRMLGSESDAADAVQDAFLSAFRGLADFAGDAKLSTWLHRIAVNACLMKLRSRRSKPVASIDHLLPIFDESGHHAERIASWSDSPAERVHSAEMRAKVRECIDALPEPYRVVLMLRDIEELDTDETARRLEITPAAVKVRLHRARQALRTLLNPVFESK